ncbi:Thioredoxin-like [Parapedobacter luteus]|uniref:Thioredoxin-like n=1 Tax=Parapedobacter luteus TaxID=623280 RepID=A0A1T5DBF7_9SPHI|nr:thioredoxin family protein [Parapedobacter luteus]SKB69009.1 Thioredoxin-like [Parapedobacter luteus]
MKTTDHFLLLLCILFPPMLPAKAAPDPDRGVQFFEGTWSEALNAAEASGKLIFVDVYTDWCPPCKRMNKEVLPLPEVGESYNTSFINYKLDAEKGDGIALAKQYEVAAYPTYLYLDAQGNLLHRAVGYFGAQAFIAHAERALASASDAQNLRRLESAFNNGQRDPAFLRSYIVKMNELGISNSQAINTYFEALPLSTLTQPDELAFLGEHINSMHNLALVFLLDHYHLLDAEQQRKLAPRLFGVLTDGAAEALAAYRPFDVKQALAFSEQLLPHLGERQQQRFLRLSLMHHVSVRDTAGVKRWGKALVDSIMTIPPDSVKAEDNRRYQAVTESFLSEAQDSTSIKGFEADKPFLVNTYTRELVSFLYEAANAYDTALADDDPALREAWAWMMRCDELMPNERFAAAANRIRARIHAK